MVSIFMISLVFIIAFVLFAIINSVINVNKIEKAQISKEAYKGKEGEKQTAIYLSKIRGYKQIINDITINDNGKTRQIDHIAITEYGVFVIETKNYSGKIYGREKSKEWQQFLGNKSYLFTNPLHQNFGHTEIIKRILRERENKVYLIVAFTRKGKLKCEGLDEKVMYIDQLQAYIENRQKILDSEQIEIIYQIINENKVTNQEYLENHNYNVQCYVQGKKDKIERGVCPRCYGKLVIKHGRYGDFYGCSNYPQCKFTKSIN